MASSSLLLSSATASMVGLSLPTPAPTRLSASARAPSVSIRSMAPVASQQQQQQQDAPHLLAEERDMRRRGIMFGAIASALTLVSNVAHAEEKKKKKCPTLCVSNPTASCCYGG